LAALRHIRAGKDANRTLVLRRYVLGLSLVAFTAPAESYLRQGCTLVLNPKPSNGQQPREFAEVYPDGRRLACNITHEAALQYATEAAEAFGVGGSRTVPFEKERAKRDVKADEARKGKAKPAAERDETSSEKPGDNG
jgi:CRISPR-associated protein Csb1